MRKRHLLPLSASVAILASSCGGSSSEGVGSGGDSGNKPRPEPDFQSALVRTTMTSSFATPSPDPSGIAYVPSANSGAGGLTIVDGEVDEVAIDAGKNVFDVLLNGTLLGTAQIASSDEPTGVTVDPETRRLFYSDDDAQAVFQVDPGADGQYHNTDDIVTSFSTSAFGSEDPEGVEFDAWSRVLFVVDGRRRVFRVSPGANGRFDGVAPLGDDTVTHFVTKRTIDDPEGIAFNTETGNLYLVGTAPPTLIEVTTSGVPVQTIDISAARSVQPAGLAYAPGSSGGSAEHLYIVDRNVDATDDPGQNDGNDGRMYEVTLPPSTPGNRPPTAHAGPDQSANLPNSTVFLDGGVGDDDLPNPPSAVPTAWTKRSGSGTATFADENAVDTAAKFSNAGTYVLRLTADDGQASTFDEVTVTVLPPGQSFGEFRIDTSVEDAEERVDGSVSRGDSDLELVLNDEDGVTGNQTVGLRFVDVDIPKGAQIIQAHVQFKTDETNTEDTMLTIQGEASDDAPRFESTVGNITSRPRTAAAISWLPPPWHIVGEAGPAQRTSDVASVVQEIVNRPGWASGNALVLIISGSGKRVAKSFSNEPTGAPLLKVFYRLAP